ncbi:hypothetical protein J5X84_44005 [Streptosporangiaceae bacterium NEAU-GS5]|nr:hypothetical protein [Streptosporangiaceae bacterium NEAU-GS5]
MRKGSDMVMLCCANQVDQFRSAEGSLFLAGARAARAGTGRQGRMPGPLAAERAYGPPKAGRLDPVEKI